ncbi:MAG: hypothetical protein KVP17_001528 [Porospora cf. gigantea B]|uniref:uncharacterized protein n=1 Tax=Porospora cf. gigantea B TaxID=2853592 RepID=UPI003571B558|nr:MAG: hypothetical protein KVP17_001528 [Porospora cf. gigantea B]
MAGALSEKPPPNTTLHLVCAKKGVSCLAWAGHVSAFSAEFLLGTVDGMVLDVLVDHGVQGQTDVWEFFAARSDWSIAGMGRSAHKPTIALRTAWEVGASRPPSKDGSMFEIFQDLKANKIHDAIFRKPCVGPIKSVLDIVIKPLQEGVLVVVAYEDSVDVFEGPSPFVAFGGRFFFLQTARPSRRQFSFGSKIISVGVSALAKTLPLATHLVQAQRECSAEFASRAKEANVDSFSLWTSIEKHVRRGIPSNQFQPSDENEHVQANVGSQVALALTVALVEPFRLAFVNLATGPKAGCVVLQLPDSLALDDPLWRAPATCASVSPFLGLSYTVACAEGLMPLRDCHDDPFAKGGDVKLRLECFLLLDEYFVLLYKEMVVLASTTSLSFVCSLPLSGVVDSPGSQLFSLGQDVLVLPSNNMVSLINVPDPQATIRWLEMEDFGQAVRASRNLDERRLVHFLAANRLVEEDWKKGVQELTSLWSLDVLELRVPPCVDIEDALYALVSTNARSAASVADLLSSCLRVLQKKRAQGTGLLTPAELAVLLLFLEFALSAGSRFGFASDTPLASAVFRETLLPYVACRSPLKLNPAEMELVHSLARRRGRADVMVWLSLVSGELVESTTRTLVDLGDAARGIDFLAELCQVCSTTHSSFADVEAVRVQIKLMLQRHGAYFFQSTPGLFSATCLNRHVWRLLLQEPERILLAVLTTNGTADHLMAFQRFYVSYLSSFAGGLVAWYGR